LGLATRLVEYIQEATTKRYRAVIHLGATTTTDDAEGQVLATAPVPALDPAALDMLLDQFRGEIVQVPPMYAALHHEGRRLHELARAGVVVERQARPVTIERLAIAACEAPLLTIDIMCSKGTYIRSLARDIGAALGCGAHLSELRRTAVGTFTIEEATPLEALEKSGLDIMSILLPPTLAVADWPAVTLSVEVAQQVRNGQVIALDGIDGDRARAHSPDGALLALLARSGERWKPEKVFGWN
jgi:tRNA pseudouridine55 synthase